MALDIMLLTILIISSGLVMNKESDSLNCPLGKSMLFDVGFGIFAARLGTMFENIH